MNITRILTVVFFIAAIGLAYYLFSRIKFAIDEEKRIAASEQMVINKLSLIREAEIAYYSVTGDYTGNWDTLANFMENGIFYITQKTEEIITLAYGADSILVHIDTLGTIGVYDSMFSPRKYPNLDFSRIKYIPGTDNKVFDLFADEITKGGVMVDVVEVRDTAPISSQRKESNEARNKKPLRFGSRTDVTTAGNWE
jgi:hypothetical protein